MGIAICCLRSEAFGPSLGIEVHRYKAVCLLPLPIVVEKVRFNKKEFRKVIF